MDMIAASRLSRFVFMLILLALLPLHLFLLTILLVALAKDLLDPLQPPALVRLPHLHNFLFLGRFVVFHARTPDRQYNPSNRKPACQGWVRVWRTSVATSSHTVLNPESGCILFPCGNSCRHS